MEYQLTQSPIRREYLTGRQVNPNSQLPYSYLVAVNEAHSGERIQNTTAETSCVPTLSVQVDNVTQESTGLKWIVFPAFDSGGFRVGDTYHFHMNGVYINASGHTLTLNVRGPGSYGNLGNTITVSFAGANSIYRSWSWDIYWAFTGSTPLSGGNVTIQGTRSWEFVFNDGGNLKTPTNTPLFGTGTLANNTSKIALATTVQWSNASASNDFITYQAILRKI